MQIMFNTFCLRLKNIYVLLCNLKFYLIKCIKNTCYNTYTYYLVFIQIKYLNYFKTTFRVNTDLNFIYRKI